MHREGASNCGLLDIDIWLHAVGTCPDGRPGPCRSEKQIGAWTPYAKSDDIVQQLEGSSAHALEWCELYHTAADMGILLKHRVGNGQR